MFGLKTNKGQPVPLKSINVEVKIKDCIAEVESILSYYNEEDDSVEASFTFPVDDGSAVFHFEANIHGRHIVAELQEKEQAILTYEDAIEQGRTAMLLKEDDKSSDTFQCMLGNLPAHGEAQLVMKYIRELAQEHDGKVRFSLPTVLNPRYSPDAGGEVAAEGATYVAPSKVKYQFSMQATVEGYHKVVSVTSERMKLNIQHEQDHKVAKVTLAEDFRFDHDLCFLVEYEKPFTPQVLLEEGNPEAEGLLKEDILMLNFYPELKKVDMATTGDYIFVIDRSGSMDGVKMKNAREALLLCIKSLPLGCYFNIVSFGSNFSLLFKSGSQEYSKSTLEDAQKLLESMNADMGGTEMLNPLKHVYEWKCFQEHPRKIFVLTDGELFGDSEDVIALVKKHANTTRLFALGIGDGVSTSLVKGIARAGGGDAEFIADQDRLQAKVVSLLKKAMQPSISGIELQLELPPGVTSILIPSEPPTFVTAGMRMTVYALLQGIDQKANAMGKVILNGYMDKESVSYKMEFILSKKEAVSRSSPVHRLATKTQIKLLEDQVAQMINTSGSFMNFPNPTEITDVCKKIVNLSKHGNIISKYTAFVAVDKEGKEVEGTLVQRLCPVPTLSNEFVDGLHSVCAVRQFSPMSGKKKSLSLKGFLPVLHLSQAKEGIFMKSFRRLSNFLKPQSHYSHTDNFAEADKACSASKQSEDHPGSQQTCVPSGATGGLVTRCDKMLAVISLQEISGNWTMSEKLMELLDVSRQALESSNIAMALDVMCTLAVIAWLRKDFCQQHDEWQMIETKALSWLTTQNLSTNVDDLLKQMTHTLWPAI